jgi:hypothetical protein
MARLPLPSGPAGELVYVASTMTKYFQVRRDSEGFVVEEKYYADSEWHRLAWFADQDDAVTYADKRNWDS